jgi:hypothetical protein
MDDGGAGAGAARRGLASHRRGSPVTRPADAGRRADKDAVAGRRDFDGVGGAKGAHSAAGATRR